MSTPEAVGEGDSPRAVLDTSVPMSAHRHWLWAAARQGDYLGFWSPFIINELVRIRVEAAVRHGTPREVYRQRINDLIHSLSDVLLVADYRRVDASGTLKDPDDEAQAAAALAVHARYIVSLNERDFPKDRMVRGVRFSLPQEFLAELTIRRVGRLLP